MKNGIIKYFILFIIFISCKKEEIGRVKLYSTIRFNSINVFDNQEMLTRIPTGIYFEIELENFNFKIYDTVKYLDRYISKIKLITKKKEYQLLDLRKSNLIKNKKLLVLNLLLINEYSEYDMASLTQYLKKEVFTNDAYLILKTDEETFSVKIDSSIINYYYNLKKVETKNISKYFEQSYNHANPRPSSQLTTTHQAKPRQKGSKVGTLR